MIFSFLILASSFMIVIPETNYCDPELCNFGDKHTACNNNGSFAEICSKDAQIYNITHLQDKILDAHNFLRNKIASGHIRPYLPARRMATMVWSPELAMLAELQLKTCTDEHDICHNTEDFRYSGQNLAFSWKFPKPSTDEVILQGVTKWFDEYKYANMAIIKSYKTLKDKIIGHFTAMVIDKNVALGCAVMTNMEEKLFKISTTCNYARGNVMSKPIYSVGKPGSSCMTHNPQYTSLCGIEEEFDPNDL